MKAKLFTARSAGRAISAVAGVGGPDIRKRNL